MEAQYVILKPSHADEEPLVLPVDTEDQIEGVQLIMRFRGIVSAPIWVNGFFEKPDYKSGFSVHA